jgi:hypothetical protein
MKRRNRVQQSRRGSGCEEMERNLRIVNEIVREIHKRSLGYKESLKDTY